MTETNVSIVIPIHNMVNRISECYNAIYRQIYFGDQIILINRGSVDGLARNMFPKDKRIVWIEENQPEPIVLNKVIREHATNDCILILDPIAVASANMVKWLKGNYDPKRVRLFRTDRMNDKRKVIADKKAGAKGSPDLCNMYAMSFSKKEGEKIGLFNEYFDRDDTCSHGVFFCHIMKEVNGCEIDYIDNPRVVKQIGKDRKNVDGDLLKILKKKVEDETYKFKNSKGIYTVLNPNKLKNITVIIPSKQNKELIDEVKTQLTKDDELIVFNSGLATIDTRVKKAFEEAKNDYVLLLNPRMSFFVPDYVVDAKLSCNDTEHLIIVSDDLDISEVGNVNNISMLGEDIGMATNIRGIGGKDGIEVTTQSDTNKIIKRISATPDKKKRLLERVEKNYAKGRKRVKRKAKENVEVDYAGKKRRKERPEDLPRYQSLEDLPRIRIKNRRPRVLFICDVKGWAWWNKSHVLKEYLADEFDIDVVNVADSRQGRRFNTGKYDIYFTYGYSYVHYLRNVPFHKRVSGVTAHRPLSIIKNSMRSVAITHANSMLLYNDMQKIHPIVFYIPNGVDTEMFYPTEPIPEERDNIMVGHVGKLCEAKGQKQIIEPAVKKANADYVNNYATYLKKKPQNSMIEIYNEMDVFICASLEDGTPNPCLEAAACGRPIISNRIGNMPEFIIDGYNGFIVDRDVNAYVEKINYLRDNRDKLIEMGQNARKTAEEEWTWRIQAERYRDMFKAILKID